MPVTIKWSFAANPPNLVYLWIKDDKVEIRDASHLQGKGAVETSDADLNGIEGAQSPGGGDWPGR